MTAAALRERLAMGLLAVAVLVVASGSRGLLVITLGVLAVMLGLASLGRLAFRRAAAAGHVRTCLTPQSRQEAAVVIARACSARWLVKRYVALALLLAPARLQAELARLEPASPPRPADPAIPIAAAPVARLKRSRSWPLALQPRNRPVH